MRDVAAEDMELLFAWSNDPQTRQNSFSSEPIPFEAHQRWLRNLLADCHQRAYLLLSEEPVGLVRFRIDPKDAGKAELGYSIAPGHRGKGLAVPLLNMGADRLAEENPQRITLVARVKVGNLASIKSLLKAGFTVDQHDPTTFKREIL